MPSAINNMGSWVLGLEKVYILRKNIVVYYL